MSGPPPPPPLPCICFKVATLQALVGDDVETAVKGLGLVRALEVVTSVPVPSSVSLTFERELDRRAHADDDGESSASTRAQKAVRSAVTTYVQLVFERVLTARWAPKSGGTASAVGRYKFSVPGFNRPAGFRADHALRTEAPLVQLVTAYVDAVLARALPTQKDAGTRVDCACASDGPQAGPHPLWAPPHMEATGSITFGKDNKLRERYGCGWA